ncbi:hypothetical protein Fmac_011402 [Flemingia macrophylla]|uniref:Uncharacterized protein n=1 Tax=Flemingia macrophylla TaxID=520843 RepID=A0ABD1MMC9_9FABA
MALWTRRSGGKRSWCPLNAISNNRSAPLAQFQQCAGLGLIEYYVLEKEINNKKNVEILSRIEYSPEYIQQHQWMLKEEEEEEKNVQ